MTTTTTTPYFSPTTKKNVLQRTFGNFRPYATWKGITIASLVYMISLFALVQLKNQNEQLQREGLLMEWLLFPFAVRSVDDIYAYLDRIEFPGRAHHILCTMFDMFPHMFCYSVWMLLLSQKLFANRTTRLLPRTTTTITTTPAMTRRTSEMVYNWCVVLICITYMSNILESICIYGVLYLYPEKWIPVARLLIGFTSLKFISFFSHLILMIYSVYYKITHPFKMRREQIATHRELMRDDKNAPQSFDKVEIVSSSS